MCFLGDRETGRDWSSVVKNRYVLSSSHKVPRHQIANVVFAKRLDRIGSL